MQQVEGVQFPQWEQTNFWEFKMEIEAVTHGFYTIGAAMQVFPRLFTGGVPATSTCGNWQCLQCAVHDGKAVEPDGA